MSFFKENKPFFKFLIIFFSVYSGLFLLYQLYHSQYNTQNNEVDYFTKVVANQSSIVISLLGYKSDVLLHQSEPSYRLSVNNKYVVRVVEGCNAISLMILFVAFVIAFRGTVKKTIYFLIVGVLIIHILNIIRITLITIGLFHRPELEHILHGVLFPLIIYGTVFLLWIIWVKKYSDYANQ